MVDVTKRVVRKACRVSRKKLDAVCDAPKWADRRQLGRALMVKVALLGRADKAREWVWAEYLGPAQAQGHFWVRIDNAPVLYKHKLGLGDEVVVGPQGDVRGRMGWDAKHPGQIRRLRD